MKLRRRRRGSLQKTSSVKGRGAGMEKKGLLGKGKGNKMGATNDRAVDKGGKKAKI